MRPRGARSALPLERWRVNAPACPVRPVPMRWARQGSGTKRREREFHRRAGRSESGLTMTEERIAEGLAVAGIRKEVPRERMIHEFPG